MKVLWKVAIHKSNSIIFPWIVFISFSYCVKSCLTEETVMLRSNIIDLTQTVERPVGFNLTSERPKLELNPVPTETSQLLTENEIIPEEIIDISEDNYLSLHRTHDNNTHHELTLNPSISVPNSFVSGIRFEFKKKLGQIKEIFKPIVDIFHLIFVPSWKGVSPIKTMVYFFLWYFFTVVYNISNKRLLNDFPLPLTVSSLQLVLGIPVFLPLWLMKPIQYNRKYIRTHARIAAMHGLGNIASVISFGSGSVSFTHVVKALEPVVAAILSAIISKQYFSYVVYLSLVPIVVGVAIASATEISFTWVGLISAMASNVFYQMRMVLAKEQIGNEDVKITPANLFRIITILAVIESIPIVFVFERSSIVKTWNEAIDDGVSRSTLISNMLISGISYYMYNEVAFWLLDIIHPITHAVGNTIKRVVIILASILILKSPVSIVGLFGSCIAIAGTLLYSLAHQRYKTNVS